MIKQRHTSDCDYAAPRRRPARPQRLRTQGLRTQGLMTTDQYAPLHAEIGPRMLQGIQVFRAQGLACLRHGLFSGKKLSNPAGVMQRDSTRPLPARANVSSRCGPRDSCGPRCAAVGATAAGSVWSSRSGCARQMLFTGRPQVSKLRQWHRSPYQKPPCLCSAFMSSDKGVSPSTIPPASRTASWRAPG
jgi:hypothetical protein